MHDNDRTNGTNTHGQGSHYQAVAALGRVAEMQAIIIHRLITPQPSVLPALLEMLPALLQALGMKPTDAPAAQESAEKPVIVVAAA